MNKIARRMADIQPFHVMEILKRAHQLEAAGRDIIHLEVGEPDFPTPPTIVEAARDFLAGGHVHYTPALGLTALREAIARFYHDRFGADVAPERIIVTPGASGALMLALASLMVAVFAATDVFLFYVVFEAMLIPVYFLIGIYGGSRRKRAATVFLLYSLAGGLIMLVAVIGLYLAGPRGTEGFLVTNLMGLDLPVEAGRWLFLGFFIAFAIKAPMTIDSRARPRITGVAHWLASGKKDRQKRIMP